MSNTTFSTMNDQQTVSPGGSSSSIYKDTNENYVFELIGLDVSLNLDVSASYEDTLLQQGLAAANALAEIDLSATEFSGMFKITIDSSDVDDIAANDVIYDVSNSTFPTVVYSSGTVTSGQVNATYTDQSLKKDVVRHIAYLITGGYAATDIFSNESALQQDVVDHDASFTEAFSTILAGVTESTDPLSTDVLSTAKNLLAVNLGVETRRNVLFADISNAEQTNGTITVPLKFAAGDRIVVRINYSPAENHPPGGTVTDRSYKFVINLN